jgi:hypothetical protein
VILPEPPDTARKPKTTRLHKISDSPVGIVGSTLAGQQAVKKLVAECEKHSESACTQLKGGTINWGAVVKAVVKYGGPASEFLAGVACVTGVLSAEGCPYLIASTTAFSAGGGVLTHQESPGAATVDAVFAAPGFSVAVADGLDMLGGGKTIANGFGELLGLLGNAGSYGIDRLQGK